MALPLFCLASCSDDETPVGNTDNGGEVTPPTPTPDPEPTPDPAPQYEGFEGYMFVLDQSQIPNLGGYEPDRSAPQAKLMYISPEGQVTLDAFAGQDAALGFDCRFDKVGGHFVIFAKKETLADDQPIGKATVIEGKSLKIESQHSYSFDKTMEPDFIVAVSKDMALVGFEGRDILSLDLKSGKSQQIATFDYNRNISGMGYEGKLFLFNGNTISILSGKDGKKESAVTVEKSIRRVYSLRSDLLLIRTNEGVGYIFSMKENAVKGEVMMDETLSWDGAALDEETNMLYVAGTSSRRDKVYTLTVNDKTAEPKLFYTIPASDINKSKQVTGAIRMGINPDTRDLYIGHVADLVIVGGPGARRSSRAGYISRILLTKHDSSEALLDPDEKVRIEDMFLFSPMIFLGK